ncbi:nucleoside recognition protein [Lutibacter sp. B2]|nr:nucleoside recognition protein [Lutibacter sp. B2]
MINLIWLGFIVIGIVVALVTGNIQAVTDAAFEYADVAVELSIGLVGVMALWLGLMKIAEESGMVKALGNALRPVMKYLFPEVPQDHPAMGAMVMNIAANIFGLGNAATPLGIKAMKELQELNDEKDTATNSMCTFLAINTSSVTLIASSVVAYRAAAGSANPAEIIGPTIIATVASTIAAIVAVKLLQKLPAFNKNKEKSTL